VREAIRFCFKCLSGGVVDQQFIGLLEEMSLELSLARINGMRLPTFVV